MGFFTPPPGDTGANIPDIPIPDFVAQAKQTVSGLKAGGFWERFVAVWWAGFMSGVTKAVAFLVGGMDDILAMVTTVVTSMQGTNQPGFFSMVAAVMGDLLGMEFDADIMRQTFQTRGPIAAMTQVGGTFYGTLEKEFQAGVSGGSLKPTPDAAKAFLGFLISFSVRQGNLAFISELIPAEFNIMGGIREYGETLARSLGLGRLARRALQPLINTLVANPLTWSLNNQYRPKLLSAGELIRGFFRNAIPQDKMLEQLRWQGYPEWAIQAAIADHRKGFGTAELLDLVRMGELGELAAVGHLKTSGMTDEDAQTTWDAAKFSAATSLNHRAASELLSQVHAGLRDMSSAMVALEAIKMLPEELEAWKHIFGTLVEVPRKQLTEAELERAYLEGIIDLSTIQDAWRQRGFSDGANQILTFLLLAKQNAGNKAPAGHVPHKALTEAQLEKAYASGIIDLVQLQAGWHKLGYSPDDQQVLSLLVQIKTPGPGQTQIPGMTTP